MIQLLLSNRGIEYQKQIIEKDGLQMKQKLMSRKLWMSLLAAIVPIVNEQIGLGLSNDTVLAIIGALVAFVLGESHVDAKRAANVSQPPVNNDWGKDVSH